MFVVQVSLTEVVLPFTPRALKWSVPWVDQEHSNCPQVRQFVDKK